MEFVGKLVKFADPKGWPNGCVADVVAPEKSNPLIWNSLYENGVPVRKNLDDLLFETMLVMGQVRYEQYRYEKHCLAVLVDNTVVSVNAEYLIFVDKEMLCSK